MAKLIYILEDNTDISEILELILMDTFEVHSFPNIASFMVGQSEQLPDLFILDVMLPDGNGIDVCCRIRAEMATRHIPVVMMSANYSKSQMADLCQANDFISKPFDINDFYERVVKQLDNASL